MNAKRLWSWGAGIGLLLTIVGLFWLTAANVSAQAATPAATRTPRATATRTVTTTETLTATEEMTGTEEVTATEAATLTGDALLAQEMDAMLTDLADAGRYGGSVLVARDGVPILSKGYGLANAEWDIPNSPTTKFRIAHLTMLFTALAILQLQEQGLLDVQDSVCEHLDPCPEAWQPITLHDLLIHTSGVPDYTGLADYEEWKRNPTTPDELIGRVADLPLESTPGEEQRYSLTNYLILGRIVENVADMPLARYLRDEILEPLGMANTGLDVQGVVVPQRASGYEIGGFGADYVDPSVLGAARGMYSTTEDLLRFNEALYSGELLPLDALEPMLTPQTDEIPGTGWIDLMGGYGWFFQTFDDRPMVFHGGPVAGFYVAMNYLPDEKITVIALNNREDVSGYGTADTLTEMILASE
jgi:CubicO group peptidase (beta-lactamase class C family)